MGPYINSCVAAARGFRFRTAATVLPRLFGVRTALTVRSPNRSDGTAATSTMRVRPEAPPPSFFFRPARRGGLPSAGRSEAPPPAAAGRRSVELGPRASPGPDHSVEGGTGVVATGKFCAPGLFAARRPTVAAAPSAAAGRPQAAKAVACNSRTATAGGRVPHRGLSVPLPQRCRSALLQLPLCLLQALAIPVRLAIRQQRAEAEPVETRPDQCRSLSTVRIGPTPAPDGGQARRCQSAPQPGQRAGASNSRMDRCALSGAAFTLAAQRLPAQSRRFCASLAH